MGTELLDDGSWRAEWTGDGSWTLVSTRHGEACHSCCGAWTEARERYARACRLTEIARSRPGGELVLLDVGCGVGLNLAAALEALHGSSCRLRAISLESDLTVIRSALGFGAGDGAAGPAAPWLGRVHRALGQALGEARGMGDLGGGHGLRLVLGDAREAWAHIGDERRFDAVFLDPFAPQGHPDLWQPGFLGQIARRMAPGSILSTYSASFPVRRALRGAGLGVGLGGRVGAKREGTLASPDRALPALPERVERRLARSAVEGP